MTDNIEILAPGGSLDALKAAVDSGADAVYFGGSQFGARANAVNLTNEQIIEAVVYAHLRSAKVYVTVNTLVFDTELNDAFEFLKFCYNAGVDAVIVQDMAVARMIRKFFPDFRLHASTQMTIHNLDGVVQAGKFGFDRVVLSRELSFEEIKYIADNTDVELEVFVHGALCMSYSGQCMMSSFLGGRSGNRGLCAQPCRLAYTLLDSSANIVSPKDKYLMSLKDLCLVDYISELKAVGVTSLKIEGRMKSEAYVSAVAGIYNKYRYGGKVSDDDRRLLTDVFSRSGFTDGYYKSNRGRDMLSFDSNHDKIHASVTEEVVNQAKSYATLERKRSIEGHFVMKRNEVPVFEVSYNGKIYRCEGDVPAEPAQNVPSSAERITEQLSKLGGTVFEYSSLTVDIDDGLYIPVKLVNNLRRDVIAMVESDVLGIRKPYDGPGFTLIRPDIAIPQQKSYTASVLTELQADTAYDLGFEKIYIPYSLYMAHKEKFDADPDIYCVKLPPIAHDSCKIVYDSIKTDTVIAGNISHFRAKPEHAVLHGDYRLNCTNTASLKELGVMGLRSCCLSPELTLTQIKQITKVIPAEIVIYGRLPLMTVRNCLVRSALNKCGCKSGEVYYLRDRKRICFPVITDRGTCTNTIYNSAPVVMSDRMHEIECAGCSIYRFEFTVESPDEMYRIMKMYEKSVKPDMFFTRGHFYNGVL